MNNNMLFNEEPDGDPNQAELDRLAEEERKRLMVGQRRQENAIRMQRERRPKVVHTLNPMAGLAGPSEQAAVLNQMTRATMSGFANENARRVRLAQDERERQHEIDLLLLRLDAEKQS